MVSRRIILITGGAGVALAGACALRLHSNLAAARAPWSEAGESFGDARLDALACAVLAPSPHNLQPWLVRLDGDDGLTLFCDLGRRLPATDPLDRQTVIGLGAFVELLRQAAAEKGYGLEMDLFPEGEAFPVLDARPIASMRFVEDAQIAKDPLFAALLTRRTSRTPYDQARPVSAETMNALDAALRAGDGEFEWVSDAANVEALKTICREAWITEMETPGPRNESAIWTRIGEKEINAAPDGISLYGPVMEAMGAVGLLSQKAMNDPETTAFAETVKFYNRNIDTAMAFGWLSTANNTRTDQLRAGAGWVRLQQAAAGLGLAMQPLSQALQEYPAMSEIYEEIHDFAGIRLPARMQGIFRFGYVKTEPASPRWPMESRLIDADA